MEPHDCEFFPHPALTFTLSICGCASCFIFVLGGALLPAFFDEWLPELYCCGLFVAAYRWFLLVVEGFERLYIFLFFLFSLDLWPFTQCGHCVF